MAFAGAFTVQATLRIRRSGIKAPSPLEELPVNWLDLPPTVSLQDPIVFRCPRLGFSLLVPVLLLFAGIPCVLQASPSWGLVGALAIAAAIVLGWRACTPQQ